MMSGKATNGSAIVWCPFPDEAEVRSVARRLMDERLIACVNIVPGMVSLYEWEGRRGEMREVGALFKTHVSLRDDLIARLAQLHSYESPAITAWDTAAVSLSTQEWFSGLLTGGQEDEPG